MKRTLFAILFVFVSAIPAWAATDGTKVSFDYDLDFDFRFDNREYSASGFYPSMTVFGARLTPAAGIRIDGTDGSVHRLMAGVDIMKDFGSEAVIGDVFRELVLYYQWKKSFGRTDMTLAAGIFPRSFMGGNYSTAFFSDSLAFYDTNLEGLILKFSRPSAYYEVGCDWMGQKGDSRRERFMIFSSGEASLVQDFLKLGYSGYMYHFAGSREVAGVVDNILLNPYIGLDLSRLSGLQDLNATLGWLQSFQNDRRNIGRYTFPHGGELTLAVRNWNVGMENRLFYGTDMMPYYDRTDAGGCKYGNRLYFGDPFFRVKRGGAGMGLYDRLELYYEPRIASFLTLKVSTVFHFNEGYSGWQQVVSLKFDLPSLMSGHKSSRH